MKEDDWQGIHRVHIPATLPNALGTIQFDWNCIWHALRHDGLILTLGYNTAAFTFPFRLAGRPQIMNMDGIEWSRQKWSWGQKVWLYINEFLGARIANHLIADHPEIARHLSRHIAHQKISTITYGAEAITEASDEPLRKFGVLPQGYFLVIGRPEPENSILEIVQAFSAKERGKYLVVLGKYSDRNKYHRAVLGSASKEVLFPGAIYESNIVRALRFHACAYIHGHQVGGTNPSLVESLAAGSAIIAHDNRFNRWVAGNSAIYFSNCENLIRILDSMETHEWEQMRAASRIRHAEMFTLAKCLTEYEHLLSKWAITQTTGSDIVCAHLQK